MLADSPALLSVNDAAAFELLATGDGEVLRGLGDDRISEYMQAMQPATIEEFAILVSLAYCEVDDETIAEYCLRKRNAAARNPPHPIAQSILMESLGLIVYREQIVDILCATGFSRPAAARICQTFVTSAPDDFRRTILGCEHVFRAGKCGIPGDETVALLELLECRARHVWRRDKAMEKAVTLYWRAYEKAHFPGSFVAEETAGWEDG